MTSPPPLARRGTKLVAAPPLAPYIEEHRLRSADIHPDDPDRYIGLAVSQNLTMWDLLEPRLNEVRGVKATSLAYDDMTGSEDFRTAVARFASANVWGRPVAPNQVVILAGVGSILESLFYVIADPGDGVLVPTPSYSGFWLDLEVRDYLTIVPVHTTAEDDFRLTPELLENAYQASSVPITSLILTNPNNPTGRMMTAKDLSESIAWARGHGLHIVVNGIYALSVHGESSYVPVVSAVDEIGSDIHEIWGFSKDFAMSGIRCGVMTSNNAEVLDAIRGIAYWSAVSGDTQHLLAGMLNDEEWSATFVETMQKRLAESYRATTGALKVAGIPYMEAEAGLFLIVDLRQYLDEPKWEAEDRLWRRMLDKANVNLTPGSACRISEPGFFRICFATEPPEVVAKAITRLTSAL